MTAKEIWSRVVLAEQIGLLVSHDRSELLQVADHQELHAAERSGSVAESSQHGIHCIQKVASHHTDLIYHKDIYRAYDAALFFAERKLGFYLGAGNEGVKRQLKE